MQIIFMQKILQGADEMTHKQENCVKAVIAGAVTGGLAFLAVKSLCRRRSFRRMTAAKAFKLIGTLMNAF